MQTANDRFLLLLSLRLSGEATENELTELDNYLKTHPNASLPAEIIEKLWKTKHKDNTEQAYNKHLQRLSNHLSEPALQYEPGSQHDNGRRKKTIRVITWTAGVAACLAIGLLFSNSQSSFNPPSKPLRENSVSTRPGSKSRIELPDGTEVKLNSGSKLTYNESFMQENREVYLTGEAYFDVVKNKEHPFIIHTAAMDIKVIGTAFNVRSYPTEKITETALIRGSVEIVLRNNPGRKIILKPHEKLVVQNDATPKNFSPGENKKCEVAPMLSIAKLRPLKDSATMETSWVNNILVFDNEPLEDVAQKIERWYDVKINIRGNKLKAERYSSVFEDETLEQVMEALQLTGSFHYKVNKREISIWP
jgi:transmembrane sensor